MNFKEHLALALEKAKPQKKFKINDKVKVLNRHLEGVNFKIEKINHFSYDVVVDISKEELERCEKIYKESFYFKEYGFENCDLILKDNLSYSMKEINFATNVLRSRKIFNVPEDNLVKI